MKQEINGYLAHITEVLVQQLNKQVDRLHQQELIIRRISAKNKV